MRCFVSTALVLSASVLPLPGGSGYDSGGYPTELVKRLGLDGDEPDLRIGEWLRIRGFVHAPVWSPGGDSSATDTQDLAAKIQETRDELLALRKGGYRSVCFLRWEQNWPSGGRSGDGTGNRSPMDLFEAYRRAYDLASTYGDLVDAWEIENEPDAGFFADNADVFAAFYKAVALGLAAGRQDQADGCSVERLKTNQGASAERNSEGLRGERRDMSGRRVGSQQSLVVMPPLVLPPGPYLEQLRANGFLSYTEGANLHYYGFADDYGRMHARFREALGGADDRTVSGRAEMRRFGLNGFRAGKRAGVSAGLQIPDFAMGTGRRLPVFISEWGYARLDGYAAQTVEGRVRQWRYCRELAYMNDRLRVHAPMAFFALPYFEYGAKEYGLTMPKAEEREAHFGFVVEEGASGGLIDGQVAAPPSEPASMPELFHAGGLSFTARDFGVERPEKWMDRIGDEIGAHEVSPALAWMIERARRRDWQDRELRGPRGRAESRFVTTRGDLLVHTEAPSPVVMDLLAGEGMEAVKAFCGYVVGLGAGSDMGRGGAGVGRSGAAKLVFYHFGGTPAEIRLVWPQGMRPTGETAAAGDDAAVLRLRLAPGERREIPVELSVSSEELAAEELTLIAEVQCDGERTRSRWATRLFPHPEGMRAERARSLVFPANVADGNRGWLLAEQADEEAKVVAQGRWVVTPGVVVEETPTKWRFHVEALPQAPMRPARAELPLPDDWAPWERGLVTSFSYRSVPAREALPLRADDPDPLRRLRTGKLGDTLEFLLRTRAGNVYCVQSPLRPTTEWATYNQPAETLTPGFPGRHAAPLQVGKEPPASLFFFFRPAALPTVYEIDRPMLAHWRRKE